jgi:hypothetical protein
MVRLEDAELGDVLLASAAAGCDFGRIFGWTGVAGV